VAVRIVIGRRGRRLLFPLSACHIDIWQVPWAEFHSTQPVPVNLDGEPTEYASVRYEIIPFALGLILPDMCPLIGNMLPAENSI
jgi:hypothetical protein